MRKGTRQVGQGMTEYIMLVGLVAILMVGAVKGLQVSVGGAFDKASQVITDVGEATASGEDAGSASVGRLASRMKVNRDRRPTHEDAAPDQEAPLPGSPGSPAAPAPAPLPTR